MKQYSQTDAMMSVTRAMAALRLIGAAPDTGLRSTDISLAMGLHKTSTSRLLATLSALGAIDRDRNRRYRIAEGFRITFGTPVGTRRLRNAARLPLGLLADRLGDATFLSVRSGLDALCIERQIGSFPIQALSLNVGGRRPLGVGAGSLALLAWLPEDERVETLALQAERLSRYRIGTGAIADCVTEARLQGFARPPPGFVVRGMTGLGVPVRDGTGLLVASLSVAGINERLEGKRQAIVVAALQEAATLLEHRLRNGATNDPVHVSAA